MHTWTDAAYEPGATSWTISTDFCVVFENFTEASEPSVSLCLRAVRETMTCCQFNHKTTKSLVFHSALDSISVRQVGICVNDVINSFISSGVNALRSSLCFCCRAPSHTQGGLLELTYDPAEVWRFFFFFLQSPQRLSFKPQLSSVSSTVWDEGRGPSESRTGRDERAAFSSRPRRLNESFGSLSGRKKKTAGERKRVALRGLLFQLLQLSLCDYFIIFHLFASARRKS